MLIETCQGPPHMQTVPIVSQCNSHAKCNAGKLEAEPEVLQKHQFPTPFARHSRPQRTEKCSTCGPTMLPKHPAPTVKIKECKQKLPRRYGVLSHAASMPYATKFRKNNDEPETLQMNCKAALN